MILSFGERQLLDLRLRALELAVKAGADDGTQVAKLFFNFLTLADLRNPAEAADAAVQALEQAFAGDAPGVMSEEQRAAARSLLPRLLKLLARCSEAGVAG